MDKHLIDCVMFLSRKEFEFFIENAGMAAEETEFLKNKRTEFEAADEEIKKRFIETIRFRYKGDYIAYLDCDNMYRSFMGRNSLRTPEKIQPAIYQSLLCRYKSKSQGPFP